MSIVLPSKEHLSRHQIGPSSFCNHSLKKSKINFIYKNKDCGGFYIVLVKREYKNKEFELGFIDGFSISDTPTIGDMLS
jgi:hypothetical protein